MQFSQGDLRIAQGDLRITQGDLRITQGDLRITQGDLRIMQGDLRITQGDLRIAQGDPRIAQGDLRIIQGGSARNGERFEGRAGRERACGAGAIFGRRASGGEEITFGRCCSPENGEDRARLPRNPYLSNSSNSFFNIPLSRCFTR